MLREPDDYALTHAPGVHGQLNDARLKGKSPAIEPLIPRVRAFTAWRNGVLRSAGASLSGSFLAR